MSTVKKYGLGSIAGTVELGKGGPRLNANGAVIEARDNTNANLVPIRAASPIGDNDVVTKSFMLTQANVSIIGEIYNVGGTPTFYPAVFADTNVYICTQTVGSYTQKTLYWYNGTSWAAIGSFPGMRISMTTNLTHGTDQYTVDHIYMWDATNSLWIDIGPASAVTKVVKTIRGTIAFGSSSPVSIGTAVPTGANVLEATVQVVTPFNGTNPTLSLGDAGTINSIMATSEIDLTTAGTYKADCYTPYLSATQLLATLAAGGSSAGAANIEIEYSIL